MAACTVVGIPRKRIHCVFKGNMAFQEKFDRNPKPKNIKDVSFIQEIANELAKKHNFLPLFSKADIIKVIDAHDPAIITINALISAIQSHETIKIIHWLAGNEALGEPIKSYVVFNAMTLKFYPIEKIRRSDCLQCGDNVRRVNVSIKKKDKCMQIIRDLENQGFEVDPYFEPTLTLMDFDDVRVIDLERSANKNKLRNLELITAVGFKGGEIFINLNLKG